MAYYPIINFIAKWQKVKWATFNSDNSQIIPGRHQAFFSIRKLSIWDDGFIRPVLVSIYSTTGKLCENNGHNNKGCATFIVSSNLKGQTKGLFPHLGAFYWIFITSLFPDCNKIPARLYGYRHTSRKSGPQSHLNL